MCCATPPAPFCDAQQLDRVARAVHACAEMELFRAVRDDPTAHPPGKAIDNDGGVLGAPPRAARKGL